MRDDDRSDRKSDRGNSRLRNSGRAPRRCPCRSPFRERRCLEPRRLRIVFEADHRPQRADPALRPRSDRARRWRAGRRWSTGIPSTTGKMQQWQPRMPSGSRRRRGDGTASSRARAVRRNTDSAGCRALKCICVASIGYGLGLLTERGMRAFQARAPRSHYRAPDESARRRASAAHPLRRSGRTGWVDSHLRAMTANARRAFAAPSRETSTIRVGGSAASAERIRHDAPEALRRRHPASAPSRRVDDRPHRRRAAS